MTKLCSMNSITILSKLSINSSVGFIYSRCWDMKIKCYFNHIKTSPLLSTKFHSLHTLAILSLIFCSKMVISSLLVLTSACSFSIWVMIRFWVSRGGRGILQCLTKSFGIRCNPPVPVIFNFPSFLKRGIDPLIY